MPAPGLMIAAPRSGSGKTMLSLGLLRALRRRGLSVQPMKCGPDYIDPAFHAIAAGRESRNLDGWSMRPAVLDRLIAEASSGVDLVICEALMGLFDGVASEGATNDGASGGIAAHAGWPVILVMDVSGQSQSAGAVAKGFATFRPDVTIGGIILNRVASERHAKLARRGVEAAGLVVLGSLPRQDTVTLPERHLGLVQAEETTDLESILERLADFLEEHIDLEAMTALADSRHRGGTPPTETLEPPGQRIALARDAAFSFVYPHLLAGWRRQGAEILPFSPLADEAPDQSADVTWLPGGYPELHAGRIASNQRFLSGLRHFARTKSVHGECGGYMVLGTAIIDAGGVPHAMADLLSLETSFEKRKLHLGYRRARALRTTPFGDIGTVLRGHEFHYATVTRNVDAPLFDVTDANGTPTPETGSCRGNVTGSFFHVIDRG